MHSIICALLVSPPTFSFQQLCYVLFVISRSLIYFPLLSLISLFPLFSRVFAFSVFCVFLFWFCFSVFVFACLFVCLFVWWQVELAARYYTEGADEITFLNITSFRSLPLQDQPMLEVLRRTSEKVFVPLTIG